MEKYLCHLILCKARVPASLSEITLDVTNKQLFWRKNRQLVYFVTKLNFYLKKEIFLEHRILKFLKNEM